MNTLRKILHCDMDCFYAAVEQRDHKEYRGQPIVVGGDPDKRGVVATASYEARVFGIHSAMPSRTAQRLCPHAIFLRPRFEVYRQVSQIIMEIFRSYSDILEPLSLDEAYLDVTTNKRAIESATLLARDLKQLVQAQTGLTVSVGVSTTKFVAKIASDFEKPDGLTVVAPPAGQTIPCCTPCLEVLWSRQGNSRKVGGTGNPYGSGSSAVDRGPFAHPLRQVWFAAVSFRPGRG